MTNIEKALDVLIEHRGHALTTREMANAVGIHYERNWNKRAPRITRALEARGFAVRAKANRVMNVSLDPRWVAMDADAIRAAFRAPSTALAVVNTQPIPAPEAGISTDIG